MSEGTLMTPAVLVDYAGRPLRADCEHCGGAHQGADCPITYPKDNGPKCLCGSGRPWHVCQRDHLFPAMFDPDRQRK